MSSIPPSNFEECCNNTLDAAITRLKSQAGLTQDSFTDSASREAHIIELFAMTDDQTVNQAFVKHLLSIPNITQEDIPKTATRPHMMTFAQICLYKVLPCPNEVCLNCPREVVTHNNYLDNEYECPFYHHDKDKRRVVITPIPTEEFVYKANYSEERRKKDHTLTTTDDEKDKYSHNYFESLFHPLYYKMFPCSRALCNGHQYCPAFHDEQEKMTWDKMFSSFVQKDRISYVKYKQIYFENSPSKLSPRKPNSYAASPSISQSPSKLSNIHISRSNRLQSDSDSPSYQSPSPFQRSSPSIFRNAHKQSDSDSQSQSPYKLPQQNVYKSSQTSTFQRNSKISTNQNLSSQAHNSDEANSGKIVRSLQMSFKGKLE